MEKFWPTRGGDVPRAPFGSATAKKTWCILQIIFFYALFLWNIFFSQICKFLCLPILQIDMTISCIHGNGLQQLISDEYNNDCVEKLHKILPKLSIDNRTVFQNLKTDSAINKRSNSAPPCVNCDDIAAYVMCAPIPEAEPEPKPKQGE